MIKKTLQECGQVNQSGTRFCVYLSSCIVTNKIRRIMTRLIRFISLIYLIKEQKPIDVWHSYLFISLSCLFLIFYLHRIDKVELILLGWQQGNDIQFMVMLPITINILTVSSGSSLTSIRFSSCFFTFCYHKVFDIVTSVFPFSTFTAICFFVVQPLIDFLWIHILPL